MGYFRTVGDGIPKNLQSIEKLAAKITLKLLELSIESFRIGGE